MAITQKKKVVSTSARTNARSPYVINLRKGSQTPVTARGDEKHDEKQRLNWTDRFLSRRGPQSGQSSVHPRPWSIPHAPPRVDLSRGMQFEAYVHRVLEKQETHASMSRWRRAWYDTALHNVLALLRLHTLHARIHIPLPQAFPTAFVYYGKRLSVFLLISFFLVVPFGILDAMGRISALEVLMIRGRGELLREFQVLSDAAARGAWGEAAGSAQHIADRLTLLEQSLDAIPGVIRGTITLIPSFRGGARLIRHSAAASRAMSQIIGAFQSRGVSDAAQLVHEHIETVRQLRQLTHTIRDDLEEFSTSRFLPSSFAASLREGGGVLDSTFDVFDRASRAAELAHDALGFNTPRRYLVIFQNPHEIRATGGFLGSYGLLDLRNGVVESFVIPPEGSYGIKGDLSVQIASPEPLRLVNTRWQFQDANWWPDWPTTAAKIAWFWEKSQQPTVDGVIAVNGTVLEDVLRALGPLRIPDGRTTLTAATVLTTIERAIERERSQANRRQPKLVLRVIAAALRERLGTLTDREKSELGRVVWAALERREILLASRDTTLQRGIAELGWDGRQQRAARDYLMVVHANVAGGKTDAVMENAVNHALAIQPDGTAIATVTVERTHRGMRGDTLTGHENTDYVRIYVPEGSRFIDAWGFARPPEDRFFRFGMPDVVMEYDTDLARIERERRRDARTGTDIYKENGYTVFGQWLRTLPGERSSGGVRYILPFRITKPAPPQGVVATLIRALRDDPVFIPYDLAVVRQSGVVSQFTSTITVPAQWESVWRYPVSVSTSPATLAYEGDLDRDLWLGAVWRP